jgi:hypothetical protein
VGEKELRAVSRKKKGPGVKWAHLPFLALALALGGCAGEPLAQRETFHWSDQPVSFEPPPANWYREGELSGGVRGVRFVKTRGRGEAITVGEIHRIGARDKELTLDDVLEDAVLDPLRKQVGDRFDSIEQKRFLAGQRDAISFDWTFGHHQRTYHRREIYLMHDGHLFTVRFIGLPETLPLFDRVAASLDFPS